MIKKQANVSQGGWDLQLTQAVFIVNNWWGIYGNPKIHALSPTGPINKGEPESVAQRVKFPLQTYVGQPDIGVVPMVPHKPRGLYAWETVDRSGKSTKSVCNG